MEFQGEHLFSGQLGHFLVLLSFVAAGLSCFAFFKGHQGSDEKWERLGKLSFRLHTIAVFGMIGVLFYMLINSFFEYHYVWQHSSLDMPVRYIFSCFWEGQEGSFMLWIFWNAVLGNILLFKRSEWTASVMTIFSSVQVFLSSMILGTIAFGYKIGSSPFTTLLREHVDFANLPLFQNPAYLESLDGRGLNPLLQNYWMTIHPPTLFLGFALTLIPFAYALSGLWRKKYNEWMKPALPWAFVGIMVLGTGILMGGAWAYEALSFGGFWAWDPVENASLVPWLTLVGGAHLMLIHRNKGTSLFGAITLVIISFLLVLYSTFLTRSGILGDSSVHAFTDLGMSGQLLLYLLFYIVLAVVAIALRFRDLPRTKKEEPLWSREFWMFIGALVLLVSAFQIIFNTSLPVINKIFGTKLAAPTDIKDFYNSWQVPFAVIVSFIMGFVQMLRYHGSKFGPFIKKLSIALIASAALAIAAAVSLEFQNPFLIALLWTSLFAIIGNTQYFIEIWRGKVRKVGSSVAHVGFGFILLGALISAGKSDKISMNTSSFDITALSEEMSNRENLLLVKGDTLPMGKYLVSYTERVREDQNLRFKVDFFERKDEGVNKVFTLFPFVQLNPRMGNVPEPDTKHFLDHDIYTHVTYAVLEEPKDGEYDEREVWMAVHDTAFLAKGILFLDSIFPVKEIEDQDIQAGDIAVAAKFELWDFNTVKHDLYSYFILRDTSFVFNIPASKEDMGLRLSFQSIDPQTEKVQIKIEEEQAEKKDFIVLQAIVFPYINLLWLGCILMVIGTFIAVVQRLKLRKN